MLFHKSVPFSKVSRRFGCYYDEAVKYPIAVERYGATRVVMLPVEEYERLSRLDHIALSPEELTDEQINAIRTVEIPDSAHALNHLLD